ncbi:MAG: hypothetical protein KBE65_21250 [Phycisphaerae bacterium]|nr:hypothetical protein [Phycisphaerae bacterium]
MHENLGKVIGLLLSSILALNASPTMVLCMGCDGHVAIEPVGHHHDDCGNHAHPDESGITFSPTSEGASCRGCADVPLPGEAPSGNATDRSKVIAGAVAGDVLLTMAAENGHAHAVTATPEFLTYRHFSQQSIVLQV